MKRNLYVAVICTNQGGNYEQPEWIKNSSAPAELSRVLTLRSLVFYGIAFIIPGVFHNLWDRNQYDPRTCFHDVRCSNDLYGIYCI